MRKKRLAIWILASAILGGLIAPSALSAAEPYDGYNYTYYWKPSPSPNAYHPVRVIDGAQLGVGAFKQPGDFFISQDNKIYILDSGNQRIVVLDETYKVLSEFKSFQNGGKTDKFNNPQGIFVTKAGHMYIADTDNQRLVELDSEGTFIREIGIPKSEILRSNFQYHPVKISLDRANRIYVAGRGVFDGILEFDVDGNFTSFIGAPHVTFDPADYFWKKVSTQAQRDKMIQFIPTEFNNLDIDSSGFIFTTTQTKSADPVQRLNPTGINILKKNKIIPPIGDVIFDFNGSSLFVDVTAREDGMYSVLDSRKGRIFTYDEEGHLLYIFGKLGSQIGTLRTPSAIDQLGDNILTLDRDQALLTIFEPTPFGAAINTAVKAQYEGKDTEARKAWNQVLKLDANYEIAYVGIGKSLLQEGKYKEAMANFKLGYDRTYYSKAFALERKRISRLYFGPAMSIVIPLIIVIWLMKRYGRRLWNRRKKMDGKGGLRLDDQGTV